MKDKYGETIICMMCRKEIKDKKDLRINKLTGLVYCKNCINISSPYKNIDKEVLGDITTCDIPTKTGDGEY